MPISVDLPAPFSPSSAWISPCRSCSVTSSLATHAGELLADMKHFNNMLHRTASF